MALSLTLRSVYKRSAASLRSCRYVYAALRSHQDELLARNYSTPASSLLPAAASSNRSSQSGIPSNCSCGGKHFFSEDVSHLPDIRDPESLRVFKDLMAANWDELPSPLISRAKKALAKNTDDSIGNETLATVFRAAEAVQEFTGILVSIRMELDDTVGMSGENVKPLSNQFKDALKVAYGRYVKYLESFGPDELYLRKKVETELGTRLIHLKMRCSGIGSEWGEVTVLGTSGLSGSYVEQRGP